MVSKPPLTLYENTILKVAKGDLDVIPFYFISFAI